ncbi:MAG: hypothetical protein M3245_01430 [Actinomycetota bacterium]|nr:hypothetical protein [Actinomycetota bacterium]
MDLIETLVLALIVSAVGAILAWMVHGLRTEVQALRTEFQAEVQAVRTELREEIQALRTELREEIQALRIEFREEIRALRSDLTQVALAVGARPTAENA